MKFEKISNEKFKLFQGTELKNLNVLVGGAETTSNPTAGTHDTKRRNGTYSTTANGSPASSDNTTTND